MKNNTLKIVLAIVIAGFAVSFLITALSMRTRIYTDYDELAARPYYNGYYMGKFPSHDKFENFKAAEKWFTIYRIYYAEGYTLSDEDFQYLQDEFAELNNIEGSWSGHFAGKSVKDMEHVRYKKMDMSFEYADFCQLVTDEPIEDYVLLWYSPPVHDAPAAVFINPDTNGVVVFHTRRIA